MKKREFLKTLGLLTAGGVVGTSMRPASASPVFAKQSGKKIGLQLYSLGREFSEDVPGGLQKVADIGYTRAEAASYNAEDHTMYGVSPAELKKMAEDAGLTISGSHLNPPTRQYSSDNKSEVIDFWKTAVEDHVELGVYSMVQPGMPTMETHDDAALVCEIFNEAGQIAKDAGIKWGYHNHSGEFERILAEGEEPGNRWQPAGDVIYDLLLEGTDPDLVFFEMDVYWTVMGQNDPIEYFERYPGRFPILHIKDRSILGQSGMMNFERIFTKAKENGLHEFFVELEGMRDSEMTQFEGVEACYDYLNNASFV